MVNKTKTIPLKKLLIITPFFSPNVGGVETRFTNICNYLRKNGYYIYVLTYQPLITNIKGLPFERKENLEIRRFSWIGKNLFHKLLPYPLLEIIYLVPLLFLNSLFFLLKKGKEIDIIHTPGLNAGLIGLFLKFLTGKKVVLSTHTIYGFRKERWVLRKALRKIINSADKIMAISGRSKKELLDWGAKEEKIIVHTTWVDQNVFKPLGKQESRQRLKWREENFCVLFVGRLFKYKGTELILQTASELGSEYRDIQFVIIGTGEEDKRLKDASGKIANLNFLGYVSNEELPIYYSASELLIMPSWDIEPFGRVAAEALSCGLPVIARKESGFLDIADSSVARAILPKVSAIKKEILSLYHDREELSQMSAKAPEFAKRHFSEDNVKTLLEVYNL